ncbi:hypothetical protein G6F43_013395 [Rhizopus delemar]|nr:hypothetical protein G6F43_013395 [Rhizopus delemar]
MTRPPPSVIEVDQAFFDRVSKLWYDLATPEYCRSLIHSMPRRVRDVIQRALIRQVCRNYSIIHKTTTPYNPQSNGLIERFNRTLGQILQRRDDNEKKDWDQYLPAAVFAYRSMKQATTKQSPFFLLYGYEPKTPFDMKHQIYEKSPSKFEAALFHRTAHQTHNLNRIREQATKAIRTTQTAQKKAIEDKLQEQRKELKPSFNIGDIVLLYKDYLSTSWSGKLQDKWEGPCTVGQKTAARNPFFLVFVAHILLQWHKLPLFPHSKSSTCLEKSERV